MASKLVTDLQKTTRVIVAAADTHAVEIATGVEEVLRPYLREGESMPDVGLLMRLVGRWQTGTNEELLVADEAHERELGDDLEPRQARDKAGEAVRQVLIDVRSTVETTHGEAGLRRLALDGAIPVDPSVVATTARRVAAALSDPAVEMPPPRRRSLRLDRDGLAAEIREVLPVLDRALADVARENREAESTLGVKRKALERSDRATVRGGGWLAATCALAGRDDLATKVRPTIVRRSSSTDEETPPTTGKPSEGTGASTPPQGSSLQS
ncbi:MAG TPA: hypothetical protein VH877_20545 [Polyangia bacterium]|jgi:hypothetical protein|nr:hypothetical protein [Polyangia bacterium]